MTMSSPLSANQVGATVSLRRLIPTVWGCAIASSVFYVIDSGMPQPGDWLVVMVIIAVVARWGIVPQRNLSAIWYSFAALVLWIAIVNWAWVIVGGYWDMAVRPIYYVYNFAVLTVVLSMCARDYVRTVRVTLWGYALGALVNIFVIGMGYGSTMRPIGTFNNPNQLGYFGVVVATIAAATSYYGRWDKLSIVSFILGVLIAVLSLSFTAVASVMVLVATLLLWRLSDNRITAKTVAAAGALAIASAMLLMPVGEGLMNRYIVDRWVERASKLEGKLEIAASSRGYERIAKYSHYIVTGAGEGGIDRFLDTGENEIHSSIGTIVFSYGLVGVTLSIIAAVAMVMRLGPSIILFLLPVFIYGLTHQGLRFTPLWIMLGVIMSSALQCRRRLYYGGVGAQ